MNTADRKRQILDRAIQFFAKHGMDGQLRNLTKELGVTHTLLYHYFPTKEALIKEVYAGSPLSNQILGKALHEANPKNLNGKLNQTIKRGQVIFLPDHASVVTQTLTPYALPTDASESANSSSQSSDATSRRLWVRYP